MNRMSLYKLEIEGKFVCFPQNTNLKTHSFWATCVELGDYTCLDLFVCLFVFSCSSSKNSLEESEFTFPEVLPFVDSFLTVHREKARVLDCCT